MPKRLIPNPPNGLRERPRKNGTTRIWWEPSAAARELGFAAVELDERRLTWSVREAERINAELARAIATGKREAPSPTGRSVNALIEKYRTSSQWADLKPATQRDYEKSFRLIARKWGPYQVRDFDKAIVHTWYQTLRETSGDWQPRALIRKLSILMSYAEIIGWRLDNSNPCSKLRLKTPKGRGRIVSWTEFDALVATADAIGLPAIGTAITLSLLQGQRQTDCYSARCADFQLMETITPDGARREGLIWIFDRSKAGNAAALPLSDEAATRVAAALERARQDGRDPQDRLLFDDRLGRPFDADLFQSRWQEVRAETIARDTTGDLRSLETMQFRDLRRTFGVLARRAGIGRDDVGDVLGNTIATSAQLAQIYTPAELETRARAIQAIQRPKTEKKG